jgi:trehalose/maltose hydrolase-like predicted phosphorylase
MPDYDTWRVVNTSPDVHTLGQWNSICTISNGYLGLKGNVAEQRDGHCPVTLIHGLFDELDMFSQVRASGQERPYLDPRYFDTAGKSPAVANLPDPLFARLFVGEREVSLGRGEVVGFTQALDLTTGVYRYSYEYRDGAGHTTRIEMERFAALRHAHRVFMRYTVTPLDHTANIRIHSGIAGRIHSNTTGERQFAVTELWVWPPERCRLTAHTPARGHDVRLGVVNLLRSGVPASEMAGVGEHDAVYTRYVFASPEQGAAISLDRCVALVSSEDIRHGVIADLEAELDAAGAQGFDAALEEQRAAWAQLWERCDVQIDGDDPAQLGLRFCLHHLLAAGPRFSDRLSVPVKLLSGEYYQGCTFYDTDLHIVPFYTFTLPELARTCLNFRYEGLRPAREVARQLGYDGAKLAWQAGPRGEECLGNWWRSTHANIHINADGAYAVVQYVRATGDERFLAERGIDLLVETARLYSARAVHDAARDRYDLRDVTGPDEGHCETANNFYTNSLAARSLKWAAEWLAHLASNDPTGHAAAARRLALKTDEPERWRHVAERLTLLFDAQTGLYEQCAGFFQLKPLPPAVLEARRDRLVSVAPYQALNQPDVLLAMALFRDEFDPAVRRANWDFYKDKSLNLSSMSFATNAIMAADVGELDEAYKHFIITTGLDLDEALTGRRDTYAGLHGTAAGGAWLAAVCGFGGVCFSQRGLRINPNLPPKWNRLGFKLALRGLVVAVAIDRDDVVLTVEKGRRADVPIRVAGQALTLTGGRTYTVRYRP